MKKVENFQDFIKESIDVKRRDLDTNINAYDIKRLKNNGLTPYYYNDKYGDTFGLIELTKPVKKDFRTKPKEVFILTADEFEKVDKSVKKVKEIILKHMDSIELCKKIVPSIMNELIEKNK